MGPVMTISPLSGTAVRPRLPWVETARLLATLVVVMQHVPFYAYVKRKRPTRPEDA